MVGIFDYHRVLAAASPTRFREDRDLRRRWGRHCHGLVACLPQSLVDRDGPDPTNGPGLYPLILPVFQQEYLCGSSVCWSRPSVSLKAFPVGPACAVASECDLS